MALTRPTIDPSSVSSDAPDFFRVSNITVREVPDMNAFVPAPNLDSRTSDLVRKPRANLARTYRAGNAITGMQRVWNCPSSVPLEQSLQATRRDLARKHNLDRHAFEQLHGAAMRRDGRAFFKSCGPGQAYNELANTVKDLLPILPADVRGRKNPPILMRRARTAASPSRYLSVRQREAARRELFDQLDWFERRHDVERTHAFDGHSKADLHATLRELGASPPDIEEQVEDEATGKTVVIAHGKGEYRGRLNEFVGACRPAGVERRDVRMRIIRAGPAQPSPASPGNGNGNASEGEWVERAVRVEPAREKSTGGIRVFVWVDGEALSKRAHLLLTSDRLQRYALPDPPEEEPDSEDGESVWLAYLEQIAVRLELHEVPEEWSDECANSRGVAQLALRIASEEVEEATGLPLSFSLCTKANEKEEFELTSSPSLVSLQEQGRAAMAKSARSRRRASVVSAPVTLHGRSGVPSREKITQFFRY